MLRQNEGPAGFAIGDVKDLYFDDETWVIRYLVDAGSWVSSRYVLASPIAAGKPVRTKRTAAVALAAWKRYVRQRTDAECSGPYKRGNLKS